MCWRRVSLVARACLLREVAGRHFWNKAKDTRLARSVLEFVRAGCVWRCGSAESGCGGWERLPEPGCHVPEVLDVAASLASLFLSLFRLTDHVKYRNLKIRQFWLKGPYLCWTLRRALGRPALHRKTTSAVAHVICHPAPLRQCCGAILHGDHQHTSWRIVAGGLLRLATCWWQMNQGTECSKNRYILVDTIPDVGRWICASYASGGTCTVLGVSRPGSVMDCVRARRLGDEHQYYRKSPRR